MHNSLHRLTLTKLSQSIKAEFYAQALCLTILDKIVKKDAIDILAFWLPQDVLLVFKNHKKQFQKYQSLIKKQSLTRSEAEKLLDDLIKSKQFLSEHLAKLFKTINENLIVNKYPQLNENIHELISFLADGKDSNFDVESKVSELINKIKKIKEEALNKFDGNNLHSNLKNQFRAQFENALTIQLEIYALQIRLKEFSYLTTSDLNSSYSNFWACCLSHSQSLLSTCLHSCKHGLLAILRFAKKCIGISVKIKITLFSKEACQDLIFLANICHSENSLKFLKQKLFFLKTLHFNFEKNLTFLRQNLQEKFIRFVRLQRNISAHQAWFIKLNQLNQELAKLDKSTFYSLNNLSKTIEQLTYGKEKFLKRCLSSQKVFSIIRLLVDFVNSNNHDNHVSVNILYAILSTKNEELLSTIEKKEQQLMRGQTLKQKILSALTFSINQQLTYQCGDEIIQFSDHGIEWLSLATHKQMPTAWRPIADKITSYKWPSILQGPLCWLRNKTNDIFRLGTFGGSLAFMLWNKELPQIVYILNRTISSKTDSFSVRRGFNWVFKYVDKASQYTILPLLENVKSLTPQQLKNFVERLENMVRLDKLEIIKNDPFSKIWWLIGLTTYLLLTGRQNCIQNTFGYCFGSLFVKVTKLISQKVGLSEKTTGFLLIIACTLGWTYVGFPLGFFLGGLLLPAKPEGLIYAEALNKLGLHAENKPTQREIKKAYRELARMFHPDKIGNGQKMQEINVAYDVALQ